MVLWDSERWDGFLFERTLENPRLEVAFVCDLLSTDMNASSKDVPERCKIYDPKDIPRTKPDLICGSTSQYDEKYGAFFLSICDYMMASATRSARRGMLKA